MLAYALCDTLDMPQVDDPRVYLGIPTIWGRSKRDGFMYIKDKVLAKVIGWKQQFLSQVGCEVLIKVVAQAIITYPMNVFQLPARLCREINDVLVKFWWGNRNKEMGIHWVNWEDMGYAKGDSGMGFRNLMDFNTAFLAKQCWRLIHEPDSLWARVLKDRYFSQDSLFKAKRRGRASWAWSSLLERRDLIIRGGRGARWKVMNGNSIKIWVDNWVPGVMNRQAPKP